jgi:hypothetical protein
MSPCRLFRMALCGDPRPMTQDAQTCLLAPELTFVLVGMVTSPASSQTSITARCEGRILTRHSGVGITPGLKS